MLWKWFKGRYTKHVESKPKVDNFLEKLNKGLKIPVWYEVPNFKLLGDVTYEKGRKNVTVNPDSGYIVKVFVNVSSGEVRMYSAVLFEEE